MSKENYADIGDPYGPWEIILREIAYEIGVHARVRVRHDVDKDRYIRCIGLALDEDKLNDVMTLNEDTVDAFAELGLDIKDHIKTWISVCKKTSEMYESRP